MDLTQLPWGHEPEQTGPPIKNGRYAIAGETYTRVTNFAGTLDEHFGLHHWEKRVLAKGLGLRPDLAAMAAATDVADKQTMRQIVDPAMEAGGYGKDANNGSALHAFTKGLLTGELTWDTVPAEFREDVRAYFRELERNGLRQIPELTERTVINDEYDAAGTFDIGLMDADGSIILGDVKTGRIDIKELSFAIQFALYVRARRMVEKDAQGNWVTVPAPNFRTDYAVVLHVPHGTGQAHIYRVNTNIGYAAVRVAAEVRALRRLPDIITPYIPGHGSFLPARQPTPDGGTLAPAGPDYPPISVPAADTQTVPGALAPQHGVPVQSIDPARFTLESPEQARQLFELLSAQGATGLAGSGNWLDVPAQFVELAKRVLTGLAQPINVSGSGVTFAPSADQLVAATTHMNAAPVVAPEQNAAITAAATQPAQPVPAAVTVETMREASTPPPSTQQVAVAARGGGQESAALLDDEAQAIFDLYPVAGRKAAIQELVRGIDPSIKLQQNALNLCKSLVASAHWPEQRDRVFAKLRDAKAHRRPGPKAKTTLGAPDTAALPATPPPTVPVPSDDAVAAAIGQPVPPTAPHTSQGSYEITGQTGVTAETLSSPALAGQAQQIKDNVAAIANGQLPDKYGGGPIPGFPGEQMPADPAAKYRDEIAHATDVGRIETIAATIPNGLPTDVYAGLYDAWVTMALYPDQITRAIEHSKLYAFTWPHAIAERGRARWEQLNAAAKSAQ